MDQEYIWPLVGVCLGWVFSVVSAGWRGRTERRGTAAKLLARLIDVYQQLWTLQNSIEPVKAISKNWVEYERLRQYILKTHFMPSVSDLERIECLIDEFAAYDPMEAVRLRKLLRLLIKQKNLKLSHSVKEDSIYVKLLSTYEVGLDECETEIVRSLKMLARSHGLMTMFNVWFFLFGEARRKKVALAVVESLIESLKRDREVGSSLANEVG